ncbi:MAG TPA: copper resistance protein CopZ [Candidatus Ornithocaccomicrobium faecavium]|uniref:Copper resistance protein CopZ n=1 Tax=Candidatus Ornithocaccomicrobium faecavium TaxID=2840890 RepID=A0A9D1TE27_9FIRM|nr:copper resistance protein CopZ [Candidatus Ornithocaccomicrobium faecavium]
MIQYTIGIDGMVCSMCEAHINQAIRREFPVKKVTSSHSKGQTQIVSESTLDEDALRKVISATGYRVLSVQAAPYEKKGLFPFRK